MQYSALFSFGGKGYFHPSNRHLCLLEQKRYGVMGGPIRLGDGRTGLENDPMHREMGPILALLADLLNDHPNQGRRALLMRDPSKRSLWDADLEGQAYVDPVCHPSH